MIGVIRKFKTASPAVKASMALLFANLILKGISLISGPIFTRIMSADQYGIVSTFQSWQSLLTVIVTLNLSQGVFNNGMLEFKENRNQFQFALVVITAVCTGLFFLIFEIFKTPLLNMFEIPPVMVYVMVLYFLFVPAYQFWSGRQRYNPNFRFVKADICDREAVDKLFEEEHPDIVVNFAAESHVDCSIEDPGIFLQTNIIGTSVLMDACRKYGIQRYHQVSTDEVYGDLPLDRPDLFFTEETPIHTSSPYSSSKAAADLLVLAYHRTYGLPVTISRCSNNYGPYHFPEKLIPLMIANALADKPLPVYGEGLNVRDWLYVEDHCKAIDLIIHKGRVGEVYNVGGHNEKQNIEIVKIICKELGKPESLITHVGDRKGHDMRYAIDPTKIHNELGWLPETKFEDGIKKTIQWYLDNREWWETIISGEYQNYYEKMYSNR